MYVCVSVCVGGCHSVCGLLLARAAGDAVWQRETYQIPSQAGQHPHCSAERPSDAVQELLLITLNAAAVTVSDVTWSQQH